MKPSYLLTDAAFWGVWSGSALFDNYPFVGLQTKWVNFVEKTNTTHYSPCHKTDFHCNAVLLLQFVFVCSSSFFFFFFFFFFDEMPFCAAVSGYSARVRFFRKAVIRECSPSWVSSCLLRFRHLSESCFCIVFYIEEVKQTFKHGPFQP